MNEQTPVGAGSSAETAAKPAGKKLHGIFVVGGGAGGLELVTQLGQTLGKSGKAQITLVERNRTHLWKPLLHAVAAGSMDPSELELNYLAQAHWRGFRYRFGVEVRTSSRVNEVSKEGVRMASGEFIPSELVFWAAGVKAPDFLRNLDGLETNKINRLVVTRTLQTARDPSIFAMGDCGMPSPRITGPRAAARAGRPPRGVAPCETDEAAFARQTVATLHLPRFRLAGLLRGIQHRGQPEGLSRGQKLLRGTLFRQANVPLAASHA